MTIIANQQVDASSSAPTSSNYQQVPQWKCHQIIKCCHKTSVTTATNDVYEIKNKTDFRTHKRPQEIKINNHATKHNIDNNTGRSYCQEPTQGIIMSAATAMKSTKSRTRLFSQHTSAHNQQAQWYQKISLPRSNTRYNDNHIYEKIKNTFLA